MFLLLVAYYPENQTFRSRKSQEGDEEEKGPFILLLLGGRESSLHQHFLNVLFRYVSAGVRSPQYVFTSRRQTVRYYSGG
jgi:hypothetical protein